MKEIKDNFYRKDLGAEGEEKAADFLQKEGYWILARNFRTNNGEIDIIARKDEEYVFVEVKTRCSKKYGQPVDSVNDTKLKHILQASRYYIYINNLQNKCLRYDVVEVYINEKNYLINHIKNIFS